MRFLTGSFFSPFLPKRERDGACTGERSTALRQTSKLTVTVTIIMKARHSIIRTIICALLALGVGPAPAFAAKKLDNAIEFLQGAKKASDPMPMLVSARNAIADANKGDKRGDRGEAMECVKAAIAALKTGDKSKMTQKINAAIAQLHSGKDKTKKNK